jgi:outer membrane protein assembly factor BamB
VKSSPALGSDGTVYAGSDDYCLYAVNSDGTFKWRFRANAGIESSPALATDGTVYVGADDDYLYGIRGSGTLATAPWPMFQHDLKHTGRVGGS